MRLNRTDSLSNPNQGSSFDFKKSPLHHFPREDRKKIKLIRHKAKIPLVFLFLLWQSRESKCVFEGFLLLYKAHKHASKTAVCCFCETAAVSLIWFKWPYFQQYQTQRVFNGSERLESPLPRLRPDLPWCSAGSASRLESNRSAGGACMRMFNHFVAQITTEFLPSTMKNFTVLQRSR